VLFAEHEAGLAIRGDACGEMLQAARTRTAEDVHMKVGIVGIGAVGAAIATAVAVRSHVSELILVNRNRARAKAVATDIRYGLPLVGPIRVVDGEYGDLAGAAVVVITAGINEKAGGATDRADPAGRLRLLDRNVDVYREIVPRIVAAAPQAVLLIATDPPDPLADVTLELAGHARVMGTGTYLDSLRFRVHLAQRLGLSAQSVEAQVVGEHGTSSVFLWSSANVGGAPIDRILAQRGTAVEEFRRSVEHDVRYANITIIEGIGASQYGIGIVAGRIAEVVARDERLVFPVGSRNARYGVTLSLPGVVGREGVAEVLWPDMSDEEARALEHSAETLKNSVGKYITGK
jgi:L-lactate dehydrogenase